MGHVGGTTAKAFVDISAKCKPDLVVWIEIDTMDEIGRFLSFYRLQSQF